MKHLKKMKFLKNIAITPELFQTIAFHKSSNHDLLSFTM